MRVGLVSDVHGNAPALEAVLEAMPSVDVLVHAGDVVGYGPHPEAVVDTFRRRGIRSIRGNHDRGIGSIETFADRYSETATRALRWTRDQLSNADRRYLTGLPEELTVADGRLRVVHGSPADPDEYVYPGDISPRLLDGEDVLALGHTHQQVARGFADGLVVNPGSVGRPRDDDPTAAYAVLDLETTALHLRRVEYPVAEVKQAIRRRGLPDELADRLG